jgi:TRAP-type uncharacterized transport system substrate-binding protein
MKLILLFRMRWALFYLPVVMYSVMAMWFCTVVLLPLPPSSFVMAIGLPQGSYASIANRYRQELEERGINVDIVATEGASGPLNRLADPKNEVMAGFASGLFNNGEWHGVEALAAIERQPVWVFTRLDTVAQLSQLKGLRIATAGKGNPGWAVTQLLLAHVRLGAEDVVLREVKTYTEAANELMDGTVDAAVMVANGEAEAMRALSRSPGIHMVGVDRIMALMAREPRLKPFVLPQGAIELRGDVPSRDLTMLGANLHLLVRDTMHPALQRVLLDTAQELHEAPSFLQHQGEYPATHDLDYDLSPVARKWAAGERPVMEQLLPYWLAQLAELLLYAILPILILTFFLLSRIPNFFAWKVNALLQNYYGELKFLETEIEPSATTKPKEMLKLMQRLDNIEMQVTTLELPDKYADRWYVLREHCAQAREKLLSYRAR